jgi:hypothetical protein
MSNKSQLFLTTSRERVSIGHSWGYSPANLQDIKLLSPGLDYDSNVRPGLAHSLKWNKVLGLALATAVSASIWTGVVVAIARIWK